MFRGPLTPQADLRSKNYQEKGARTSNLGMVCFIPKILRPKFEVSSD
jgi:hypothetical protein